MLKNADVYCRVMRSCCCVPVSPCPMLLPSLIVGTAPLCSQSLSQPAWHLFYISWYQFSALILCRAMGKTLQSRSHRNSFCFSGQFASPSLLAVVTFWVYWEFHWFILSWCEVNFAVLKSQPTTKKNPRIFHEKFFWWSKVVILGLYKAGKGAPVKYLGLKVFVVSWRLRNVSGYSCSAAKYPRKNPHFWKEPHGCEEPGDGAKKNWMRGENVEFTYLFIYLFINLSILKFIYLFIYLFIHSSIY